MESRGNAEKQRQEAERRTWLVWQSFHHILVRQLENEIAAGERAEIGAKFWS